MSLITEASLRVLLKKETPSQLKIQKGDIVTPSARQFLREKGIVLVSDDSPIISQESAGETGNTVGPIKENHYGTFKPSSNSINPKFVSYYDGGFFEEKPEHMTHLKGNKLVMKDDARIVFRGKIDSMQAQIMRAQIGIQHAGGNPKLVEALQELLEAFRKLLRAEVLDEEITSDGLLGLTDAEIREHSHHPKEHYGVEHFLPEYHMGIEMAEINQIRASIRELELCAMTTYRDGSEIHRKDIIRFLNRMSSVAYILMCRMRGNYY